MYSVGVRFINYLVKVGSARSGIIFAQAAIPHSDSNRRDLNFLFRVSNSPNGPVLQRRERGKKGER